MAILRGIKFTTALAACVMFFVPWIDIQCSGRSVATQTGLQTIVGKATLVEDRPDESGSLYEQPAPELGVSRWVTGALVAAFFGMLLLLLAWINGRRVPDAIGSFLCATALVLLLGQAMEGFPAKDAMVLTAATDNASMEMNPAEMMAPITEIEVRLLPAFHITCVLLAIPVLLSVQLIIRRIA